MKSNSTSFLFDAANQIQDDDLVSAHVVVIWTSNKWTRQ